MSEATAALARLLPDYEVERELGRGAMAVVHLGRHRHLGRAVAIKEIAPPLVDDAEVRARFLAEARTLAGLDHPHIVPVYDFVDRDGRCLLVMEALPGGTVWDRFTRDGLTLADSVAVALATATAVSYAHARGVLHRDIKPENVMFAEPGHLKVTDFGIAKVLNGAGTLGTVDGSVLGTPAYMAPEQAEGSAIGASADVYAIGTMLFELASGRLPFDGDTPMALLVQRIMNDAPNVRDVAPQVPAALAAVIARSLARDPADRYPDADAFIADLEQATADDWGPAWLTTTDVLVVDPRRHAATVPPRTRDASTIAPRDASTIAPRDAGTIAPRDPATIAPRDPATIAPRDAGTIAPRDAGTIAPRDPVPDQPRTGPSVHPTPPDAPAPATIAPPAAPAPVVRPRAPHLKIPLDPAFDRRQLVAIQQLVKAPAPVWPWTLAAAVAIALTVLLALVGPGSPPSDLGPAWADVSAGDTALVPGDVHAIALDEKVPMRGLPGPVDAELRYAGQAVWSTTFDDPSSATLDASTVGVALSGPMELRLTPLDGGSEASFGVRSTRAWYLTAQAPLLIVVALLAGSMVESRVRTFRHGTVRVVTLATAALFAAVFAVAVTLLLAQWRGKLAGTADLVPIALVAGLAAALSALARARLGQARRRRRAIAHQALAGAVHHRSQ
jgi:serine/threonine protein kinase